MDLHCGTKNGFFTRKAYHKQVREWRPEGEARWSMEHSPDVAARMLADSMLGTLYDKKRYQQVKEWIASE